MAFNFFGQEDGMIIDNKDDLEAKFGNDPKLSTQTLKTIGKLETITGESYQTTRVGHLAVIGLSRKTDHFEPPANFDSRDHPDIKWSSNLMDQES